MARVSFVWLGAVVAAMVAGACNGSVAQSPEGLVVARDGDLFAVALTGGTEVQLTATRAWESAPAVSPDGLTIAYGRAPDASKEPTLWKMRPDGSGQSPLGVVGGSPAWAPGGKAIYFVRGYCCEICTSIWRTSPSGRATVRVTPRNERLDTSPAVSPDGRRLAFATGECEPGIPDGIVQMMLSTRRVRAFPRLPSTLDGSFHPIWSPDGSRIAFNTGLDDRPRVYVARSNGAGARAVTHPRLFASRPEWSPDGTLIAVIGTGTAGSDDVFVLRPDGTGLRPVTRSRGREFSAAWLPRVPG